MLMCLGAIEASASIVINSSSDTNPGSTIDLNINIDEAGSASTPSPWFNVSGSIGFPDAFGGTVGIRIDAMKNVSTNAATLGDELVDGNIDRDGDGYMGVSDNPNGGGIGANDTTREGLSFIVDEITGLPPVMAIQITGINVQNIGRVGTDPADESFRIVNLSTRNSVSINPFVVEIAAGTIDVSALNLIVSVGSTNPVAAIFSGYQGGFRVDGLTFDVVYVDDPAVLLPPETVSAEPIDSAAVSLEWTAGQNAESYTIYRSTNSGSYGDALASGITDLSYTDTAVENYTTYYYSIAGVAGGDESVLSEEVSVLPYNTSDTIPPVAPSGFTAVNPHGIYAELDWAESAELDVVSYSVYRSTVSGSYGQLLVSNLTTSAYTDRDIEIGETYYYVIRATDYAGLLGAPSAEQSVTASPLSGDQNVFFVLDTGDIYAFSSVASNGVSCLDQGHVTNGIAVISNPSYGAYQGFFSVPDGRVCGINMDGDVVEWPDLAAWIGNYSSAVVSSGHFNSSSTSEVHGVSYDLNTKGYYAVAGSGAFEGDIAEYADMDALLDNAPTTHYTANYNGNVCNFYYPFDDAPFNYGSYAEGASGAPYFQVAGNGNLEGWLTLAGYVEGVSAETFRLGGFCNQVRLVGAFAVLSDTAGASCGNVSIRLAGGQITVTAGGTTDGMQYVLQSKSRLNSSEWTDEVSDLESSGGSVSVTLTPAEDQVFYRVRVK